MKSDFNTLYQGRIYVANEYPTYAKSMSIVNQKLKIYGRIQDCLFLSQTCKF